MCIVLASLRGIYYNVLFMYEIDLVVDKLVEFENKRPWDLFVAEDLKPTTTYKTRLYQNLCL